MKSLSGKELTKISKGMDGRCSVFRAVITSMGSRGNVRLSIPVHGNQALKMGLLKHLMKLADLTEDDL